MTHFLFQKIALPLVFAVPLVVVGIGGCKKAAPVAPLTQLSYSVSGTKIYHDNNVVQLIGANAFHVFGAGSSDMNGWHVDISREFIGNVEEEPLSGGVIKDSTGAYLYPLQTIVDSNRANGRLTILCPFGWNGSGSTPFTGTRPTQTYWWDAFKVKLQQWAVQFKNQPDVWLEVWNEPYRYDRTDGYSDDIWSSDMNELVALIRNTGNGNIILVPCAEQGQDESVLNNQGAGFLRGKSNILFDIHAYEKWLLAPGAAVGARLRQLHQNNLPVIFGETAPMNAGVLMDPGPLLDSVSLRGLSLCAWVWKYDGGDQDALLDSTGLPNVHANNNWGLTFQSVSLAARRP